MFYVWPTFIFQRDLIRYVPFVCFFLFVILQLNLHIPVIYLFIPF
jgi:hypothetical protein